MHYGGQIASTWYVSSNHPLSRPACTIINSDPRKFSFSSKTFEDTTMFRNHGSCLETYVSSLWAAGFWYFCSMFLQVYRDLQCLLAALATPTSNFPSIYLFIQHMVGGITQLTDVPLWCLQFVPCMQGLVVYKQRLVTLDKVILLAGFVLCVSSLQD